MPTIESGQANERRFSNSPQTKMPTQNGGALADARPSAKPLMIAGRPSPRPEQMCYAREMARSVIGALLRNPTFDWQEIRRARMRPRSSDNRLLRCGKKPRVPEAAWRAWAARSEILERFPVGRVALGAAFHVVHGALRDRARHRHDDPGLGALGDRVDRDRADVALLDEVLELVRIAPGVRVVLVDGVAHDVERLSERDFLRPLDAAEVARQRDRQQSGDDRHHYEQLDEREAGTAHAASHHWRYGTPLIPTPSESE